MIEPHVHVQLLSDPSFCWSSLVQIKWKLEKIMFLKDWKRNSSGFDVKVKIKGDVRGKRMTLHMRWSECLRAEELYIFTSSTGNEEEGEQRAIQINIWARKKKEKPNNTLIRVWRDKNVTSLLNDWRKRPPWNSYSSFITCLIINQFMLLTRFYFSQYTFHISQLT